MGTAKGALLLDRPADTAPGAGRMIVPVVLAASLVIPAITAWILWLAPLDGLQADRVAAAARDFTALWGAGRAAADHHLDILPDPALFTAYLRSWFGSGLPDQIWPYPPTTLLLAAPLSQLPLANSFVCYSTITVCLLGLSLRAAGLRDPLMTVALLSPALAENLLAGQNGALTAALTIAGIACIDRRPWIAGIVLGALVIKPQFALLLPVCLLAGDRWRTLTTMILTAAALVSLSALCFGIVAWIEYLSRARPAVSAYMEAPWQATPSQLIFASAFMAARSLGASVTLAWAAQGLVTAACALAAWRTWRRPTLDPATRLATTLALMLAASPWVHAYDMPALAVAILVAFRRATRAERALLGFGWFWPGASLLLSLPNAIVFASLASVAWIARRQAVAAAPNGPPTCQMKSP